MYDHVTLGVSDSAAAEAFYATLLGAAGHLGPGLCEWEDFGCSPATDGRPVTRGLHVAFAAASRAQVDARWGAAIAAGHPSDGDPGPRPEYGPSYYGGFLRDPDGNSVEVVHRDAVRTDGHVDHLWVRVADADASKAFYDTIAATAGLRLVEHEPGAFVHYTAAADGRSGLRLLTADAPTAPVHVAFAAATREHVHAFHAAAVAAGHRDNGGPGERPEYHPGYHGAFVLDPDGHNVEVVFHDRR